MGTLSQGVNAVIAGCINPLHPNYYDEMQGEFALRVRYGVNKIWWKSWDVGKLVFDAPGYPTQCYIKIYERPNPAPGVDPIIEIGGYVALCAQPGNYLGTSDWLWMAIAGYTPFGSPPLPFYQAHLMYKGTNAGSVGMVMYPNLPVG